MTPDTPPTQWHYNSATTQFMDRGSMQRLWNGKGFCVGSAVNPEVAKTIVHAVNNFEAMRHALRQAQLIIDSQGGWDRLGLLIAETLRNAEAHS